MTPRNIVPGLVLVVLAGAPLAAGAQDAGGLQVAIGPAYRIHTGAGGIDRHGGLDGIIATVEWNRSLSGALRLVVGLDGYSGSSITTEIDVACPAEGPCAPPNPSPDGRVSGSLYDLRLGLSAGSRTIRVTAGAALGYSSGGVEEWGGGGFASVRLYPSRRATGLSLGLSGVVLDPAPGHTRAVLAPTLGYRF